MQNSSHVACSIYPDHACSGDRGSDGHDDADRDRNGLGQREAQRHKEPFGLVLTFRR
jgi:hypothetical protein